MTTIDQEWRNFAELAIENDATTLERMDLRRAFFAGAGAMYHALANSEGDGGVGALYDEIAEFMQHQFAQAERT